MRFETVGLSPEQSYAAISGKKQLCFLFDHARRSFFSLRWVFRNQRTLNANMYVSIPKVFWLGGGIKENSGAPAPITARREHLDQTVVHQNKCPLTRMKEVVSSHEEHRLMSSARGEEENKPGMSIMHVYADWSDGLCEVRGLYWSLAVRSDLESDSAGGLGTLAYSHSWRRTWKIPFCDYSGHVCVDFEEIMRCRQIKNTIFLSEQGFYKVLINNNMCL